MNRIKQTAILVLLLAAVPAALSGQEAFKKSDFDFVAKIDMAGNAGGAGLARLPLTPEIFDLAAPDFSDLRVVSSAGAETGYVVRVAQEQVARVPLLVRLYNETSLPGQQSQVTADFGGKMMKNHLQIITPGTNFRRAVLIEGSDDGSAWQKVQGGVYLFRVAGAAGAGTAYDKDFVDIPDNNQQYIRITVYYDPEESLEVKISDVKAWQVVSKPVETAAVLVRGSGVAQKKGVTEITLDAGHRNMPLHRLTLAFADENFYRNVTLYGRNEESRVEKVAMEGGKKKDRTVEVPWAILASHVIYHFSAGGEVEESTALNLAGARFRYLKVAIDNGNDKPLSFKGMELTRLAAYLEFKPEKGQSYSLYFGRRGAPAPSYDLAYFADKLAAEGVAAASLGPVVKNPDHAEAMRTVPLSERYKGIIWIALVSVVAVLALLVYRLARSKPGSKP